MTFIEAFKNNPPGAMVCIHGYKDAKGGSANYWMQPSISWTNALVRSMVAVADMTTTSIVIGCPLLQTMDEGDAFGLAEEAREAVLKSIFNAIKGANRVPYNHKAPGLAVYEGDFSDPEPAFFVRGLRARKDVIVSRVEKSPKRPLTAVKKWIQADLPRTRFRSMKLEPGRFDYVSINKQRFTAEDIYPTTAIARTA